MSSLKKIREKFGISQQEIAHWLGISRSLAAHYELGTRALPTDALLQLAKLEMMVLEFEGEGSKGSKGSKGLTGLTGLTGYTESFEHLKPLEPLKPIAPLEPLPPVQTVPKLAFQLDKAERLHQQLTIVQSKHAVLQQQLLLIQKMMANCDEYTSEKEKLWLQMLYHGLCCKISKFDESKQVPLKAKIMEMRIRKELGDNGGWILDA
ncbi:MAG: helix-turn-helix transcriptional regulator [Ferruginibacter sp.]